MYVGFDINYSILSLKSFLISYLIRRKVVLNSISSFLINSHLIILNYLLQNKLVSKRMRFEQTTHLFLRCIEQIPKVAFEKKSIDIIKII